VHLGQSSALPQSPDVAVLDYVPNPRAGALYGVRFAAPEFTSLCPVTGQPDFAHLVIDYAPGETIVESKSLKLFLGAFRNHRGFHEDVTVGIGQRLAAEMKPLWLRIGGYLAHVGMGLLLLGVIGSYAYSSEDLKMTIAAGTTQTAFGHSFTYWGEEPLPNGKQALRFEVDQGQPGHFVARPELYFNQRMGATMQTPAIKRSIWQDLYIAPASSLPADDPNAVTLAKGQAGVVGPYQITFKDFQIENHADTTGMAQVGAAVVITDTRTRTVRALIPKIEVDAKQKTVVSVPIMLGNGQTLTLANFNPNPQDPQAILRIIGLNLPLVPGRAIIEVSTKPAIGLVWTGSLLMFFGALLAWLRRRQELAVARVTATGAAMQRGRGLLPGWLGILR